jgi:Tfp pilus assembly protein PilF
MNRKTVSLLLAALLVMALVVSTGCQKLQARDELNKGVQAFKTGSYQTAVEHFKRAVSLDEENPVARLYLATAYMMQYVPGADSPENTRMAQAAHDEFLKVLEQDPKNTTAVASIAQLYFNEKKFDEAREWYRKLAEMNPNDKVAHYMIGVIAWTKTFQPRMDARAKLNMRPEDPGPLRDRKVREEMRAKNMPYIEEGLQHLEKALAIDPEYDDAMAYMNLLYRERADLTDSTEAWKKDTAIADSWIDKNMEIKRKKAGGAPESS